MKCIIEDRARTFSFKSGDLSEIVKATTWQEGVRKVFVPKILNKLERGLSILTRFRTQGEKYQYIDTRVCLKLAGVKLEKVK